MPVFCNPQQAITIGIATYQLAQTPTPKLAWVAFCCALDRPIGWDFGGRQVSQYSGRVPNDSRSVGWLQRKANKFKFVAVDCPLMRSNFILPNIDSF